MWDDENGCMGEEKNEERMMMMFITIFAGG